MIFNLDAWPLGSITGNSRDICGHRVTFRLLPLRERFDLGIEIAAIVRKVSKQEMDVGTLLSDADIFAMIERLRDLSDCPHELFDADLTAQIPVAMTAAEINLAGFFDSKRMLLSESRHKAVRKQLKKSDHADADKIGPDIKHYWFLWRPVFADLCSYEAMFIDERFTFFDIHRMHEMLDVRQFNEAVAGETDD